MLFMWTLLICVRDIRFIFCEVETHQKNIWVLFVGGKRRKKRVEVPWTSQIAEYRHVIQSFVIYQTAPSLIIQTTTQFAERGKA